MGGGYLLPALTDPFEEAPERYGTLETCNTDQGSQFSSEAFTDILAVRDIRISMDGKGWWLDNVYIEKLWKIIK